MNKAAVSGTELVRELYRNTAGTHRLMQRLRPYICPFDKLLHAVPPGSRILDIGCGAGLFLGLVGKSDPAASGIGFDSSLPAIQTARKMASSNFPDGRLQFLHIDVDKSWPAGSFDLVSIIDVLHHIPPAAQQRVIEGAFAKVRPGGRFLYKDMAGTPIVNSLWNRLHDLVVARQWIHYRDADEVATWLRNKGAEISRRADYTMGLYRHELILAEKPQSSNDANKVSEIEWSSNVEATPLRGP